MNAFVWEFNDGGSIAVIADSLQSARAAALGHLNGAEQSAPSYHRKSECRKLRTLIESGSIPQSISVGQPPYVFLTPSPERVESGGEHGNISIGSMINSQIAIASPGASYAQTSSVLPIDDVRQLISQLQTLAQGSGLDSQDQHELQFQAKTISTQLQRKVPSRSILAECLSSIRSILEGVAGNIAAAPILLELNRILKQWF